MVSVKEKHIMLDSVADFISSEGKYEVTVSPDELQDPYTIMLNRPFERIGVMLHTHHKTTDEYQKLRKLVNKNCHKEAHIFLKDPRAFFVGLTDKQLNHSHETLKHYNLSAVINGRALEIDSIKRNPFLIYFNPLETNVDGGLEGFLMNKVSFDYSHLPDEHPARGRGNRVLSKDYFLPERVALNSHFMDENTLVESLVYPIEFN